MPTKRRDVIGFLNKATIYRGKGCLDWPFGKTGMGYGVMNIEGKQYAVHRLVCRTVHGLPMPPYTDVAHRCGRPGCVNPRHLYWASHKENMKDKIAHGTLARGDRQGNAKLTAEQVRWIRAQTHRHPKTVALELGVSRPTIIGIWKRESWAWLDP